jgi:hypothetical protein
MSLAEEELPRRRASSLPMSLPVAPFWYRKVQPPAVHIAELRIDSTGFPRFRLVVTVRTALLISRGSIVLSLSQSCRSSP